MKNKTLLLNCAFLFSLSLLKTEVATAQMVGLDAYIKGTSVEIGINGHGGFEGVDESASPPLAGMHARSSNNLFGFVANPQLNSWAGSAYDGDFFTPGSPENGWGFEIGAMGGSLGNNCTGDQEIDGAITTWSHIGTDYSVDWEGDDTTSGLHFKINYLLNETDLFYKTTISITNNSPVTVSDIYYYRNLDPDNNEEISASFTTVNTIISQHNGCPGCVTNVCATQSLPWNSYFGFVAVDTNWIAGKGGFSNRDASDMYNGAPWFVQTVGVVDTTDEAIYLAYKIDSLVPSGTQTFKFCSVFTSSGDSCAIASLSTSIAPETTVCINNPVFALPVGSPAGGTYSGAGVVSGNMFDPALTGSGYFDVLYTAPGTGCVGSAITTVHVDGCTGIADADSQNNVSVYPNPITDEATVSIGASVILSNAEMRLYDVVGKEVKAITNIQSHKFEINRDGLSGGMYFYKLINKGQVAASGRLIIK